MKIVFYDLKAQHYSMQKELDEAIDHAVNSFSFVKGQHVTDFEQAFAQLLGTRHCIGVGNGTDALFLTLKALGIGSGDEVITPAFSWISSSETVTLCGAKPVFADIDPYTYTIDPADIQRKISPNTKAVIAVHLYGQAADMHAIADICRAHNLLLVEDCAQGHLTAQQHVYAGNFGIAGAFSFYPTKNLGAYGDAGAVVTADAALAEKIRRLANHGALQKDDHLLEGVNSRMDVLQAAILTVKLRHLKRRNERRIYLAGIYTQHLRSVAGISVPHVRENTTHTFHIYAIRAKNRDALQKHLEDRDIQTLIHYPQALHNLPAYRYLGHRPEHFPVSDSLQADELSLPIYPELTDEQVLYVCKNIRDFYAKHGV